MTRSRDTYNDGSKNQEALSMTAEEHLQDQRREAKSNTRKKSVAFRTPRNDNGSKKWSPPTSTSTNSGGSSGSGTYGSFPNLPYDERSEKFSINDKETKQRTSFPSVRFRDRSMSPPPRPPPAIMRAKTIKTSGGSTNPSDAYNDGYHHYSDNEDDATTENNPLIDAEAGYMQGYGASEHIRKTVKSKGGGGFLPDDLIDDEEDNDEECEDDSVPRNAKEMWMKMRDRIKRGSFMVHSFSSHRSEDQQNLLAEGDDDDAGSIYDGSFFSAGKGGTSKETTLTGKRSQSFSDIDLPYEITVRECFVSIIIYLLVGVVAYSFVFEQFTVIDSLYFTIVTGSLVGYGDLVPTSSHAKIFTSFFVIFSVAGLGLALGVLGSRFVEYELKAVETANRDMIGKVAGFFRFKNKRRNDDSEMTRSISQESLQSNLSYMSLTSLDSLSISAELKTSATDVLDEHAHWYRQMFRLICRYLPALIPVLLASLLVALLEEWNLVDALYYFVITTATIGYGDIAPATDAMKIFCIIFIPLAVAVVGHTLGRVANFVVERRREIYQRKVWSKELRVTDLQQMDWDNDGIVTKLDYVEFMLLTLKKVDAELLSELHQQFEQLDQNRSGSLTKQDLKVLAKKRLKKVRHKLKLSSYKFQLLHTCKNEESKTTPP